MSNGNYTPWIALVGIALLVLWVKGYRPPASFGLKRSPAPAPVQASTPSSPWPVAGPMAIQIDPYGLANLGSQALGLAFVQAKKNEAEYRIALTMSQGFGDLAHTTFTVPFAAPTEPPVPAPASAPKP